MVEPAGAAASAAKLAAELLHLGYTSWREHNEAKRALGGILLHLQVEIERNWKSIQDARNGSPHERLRTDVFDACAHALIPALRSRRSILDPIRMVYRQITPGALHRLANRGWDDGVLQEFELLWCALGRASAEVDRFLVSEGLLPDDPSNEDCTFRRFSELVAGWPLDVALKVAENWKQFKVAVRDARARIYTLDEVNVVTMYMEPERELRFRSRARREWGGLHSYELEEGIHELWISPAIRILFARLAFDLVALEVVLLADSDQDGWTPRRYAKRAQCRLRRYLQLYHR